MADPKLADMVVALLMQVGKTIATARPGSLYVVEDVHYISF